MSSKFVTRPDKLIFNNLVWDTVRKIPHGQVATYGQIAGLIQPPGGVKEQTYKAFGARWVGSAMAACPEDVPWHRVINAQGKISLRSTSGAGIQRELLESEGVNFDERGRINLKQYQWDGIESKPPNDKR
jgi:methylated-DNA-protein-cysteine methyltransferase-like protein